MASGLVVRLQFSNLDTRERFCSWAEQGNARSKGLGVASLGLQARLLKIDEFGEYLFFWEHILPFSFSWFMRFLLWIVTRRIRKGIEIRSVSKAELADLIMTRGFADEQ